MSLTMDLIEASLRRRRFRFTSETILQEGIEAGFTADGLHFQRHRRLAPGDIPDFIVSDDHLVEVKMKGSLGNLTRQLFRYAAHDQITHLVVVVTMRSLGNLPEDIFGKPLRVILLNGAI